MDVEQLAQLEKTLPPAFARTQVPKLLGNLISAGRLANLDCQGLGPKKIRIGRNVGYLRGDFLDWMQSRSGEVPLIGEN